MTLDEWEDNYMPLGHPEGESHGLELDGVPCLIETYELEIINRIPHKHIWTVMDDPSGDIVVVAGRHDDDEMPVVGFVQTSVPWVTGSEATDPEGPDDIDDFEDIDGDDPEDDEEIL